MQRRYAAISSNGNTRDIDEMMASSLNNLTFREREEINEEIHGINVDKTYFRAAGAIDESPEMLEDCFRRMEDEMDKLVAKRPKFARAFERCQKLYGKTTITYLNTSEFRLLFLRAERFDCARAAERMCRFIDLGHYLWGESALLRRPVFDDFDESEKCYMRMGISQVIPARDRAGRRVYVHFAGDKDFPADQVLKSRMRTAYYTAMALLELDVSAQRLGFIAIFFMNKIRLTMEDFRLRGHIQARMTNCLPMRLGAGHYCFQTNQYGVMFELVPKLAWQIVPHVRLHTGSILECMYALQSFGIPVASIPINKVNGAIDLTNHTKWLELVTTLERSDDSVALRKKIIELPYQSDILLGRGVPLMKHPGNTMFRNFIQSRVEEYNDLQSKGESTKMTWEIVRILKTQYGARFLKEDDKYTNKLGWVEVSNDVARSKVRIAFRDARVRDAKNKSKQQASLNDNNDVVSSDSSAFCSKAAGAKRKLVDSGTNASSKMDTHDNGMVASPEVVDISTFSFLGTDRSISSKREKSSHNFFGCF